MSLLTLSPPSGGEEPQRTRKTFLYLDTKRLLIVILFVLIFAMAVRVPVDTDTWWHLRSGQYIIETGRIPLHDPFSHTMAGKPWIDHGWLAQIVFYLLYANFNYAGLGLALAALATLTLAFVFLQTEGNLYLRAFITVLAAITSSVIWIVRPQMISFALTGAFSLLLYLYKHRGRNYLYLIPPLFILWVNVHGGFIVGFILLGSYIVGEALNNALGRGGEGILSYHQIQTLVGVTIFSLLTCLINPNTYKMLTYPFFTAGIGALRDYIQEWASPDFHLIYLHPFIWMFLLTLAAMALSTKAADFTDLILISLFCYMSLWAQRNIPLFALVAAPVLSRHAADVIDGWIESLHKRGLMEGGVGRTLTREFAPSPVLTAVNWFLLLIVLGACAVKIYHPLTLQTNLKVQEETLPVKAVDFIEENSLADEMFNSYNWGGYLIWRLYPRYRVFIDGRTDLYDDRFVREYLKVPWARPGWQEILNRYNVNFILIESEGVLATLLNKEPSLDDGWRPVYTDDIATIFLRNTPENQALISTYGEKAR